MRQFKIVNISSSTVKISSQKDNISIPTNYYLFNPRPNTYVFCKNSYECIMLKLALRQQNVDVRKLGFGTDPVSISFQDKIFKKAEFLKSALETDQGDFVFIL